MRSTQINKLEVFAECIEHTGWKGSHTNVLLGVQVQRLFHQLCITHLDNQENMPVFQLAYGARWFSVGLLACLRDCFGWSDVQDVRCTCTSCASVGVKPNSSLCNLDEFAVYSIDALSADLHTKRMELHSENPKQSHSENPKQLALPNVTREEILMLLNDTYLFARDYLIPYAGE